MSSDSTAESPLVRAIFPDLARELVALLEAEGEHELACSARDLRLVGTCGCGTEGCRSFRTGAHPAGQPYGPGHRTISLSPEVGMLILDVVDDKIMYVEVLGPPGPQP